MPISSTSALNVSAQHVLQTLINVRAVLHDAEGLDAALEGVVLALGERLPLSTCGIYLGMPQMAGATHLELRASWKPSQAVLRLPERIPLEERRRSEGRHNDSRHNDNRHNDSRHNEGRPSAGTIPSIVPSPVLGGEAFELGRLVLDAFARHDLREETRSVPFAEGNFFLGVPLLRHHREFGALCCVKADDRDLDAEEISLFEALAVEIGVLLSKSALQHQLRQASDNEQNGLAQANLAPGNLAQSSPAQSSPAQSSLARSGFTLQGTPIASGLARGPAVWLHKSGYDEPPRRSSLDASTERQHFERARSAAAAEIRRLIQNLRRQIGEQDVEIFHAHLLLLQGSGFLEKVYRRIEEGNTASWATWRTLQDFLAAFSSLDDAYMREKSADLEDVGRRILSHLIQEDATAEAKAPLRGIVIADNLLPSDTTFFNLADVKGIITRKASAVSHVAILARSLRIPAVSQIEDLSRIEQGENLLVDGDSGQVFVHPSPAVESVYAQHLRAQDQHIIEWQEFRDRPCTTKDGHPVTLRADVSLAREASMLSASDADGIGICRTDAAFLVAESMPTVTALQAGYQKMVQAAAGSIVNFCTLDLDSNAFPAYLPFPKEANPLLGCRSLRYQLCWQGLLRDQLRAILSVADEGNVRLILPMISHLGELRAFKRILAEVWEALATDEKTQGSSDLRPAGPRSPGLRSPEPRLPVPLGVLFETPASVLLRETLAAEADFLAVGGNDLTQYTLAVDRDNPAVHSLYDPLHPAVLIQVHQLVETARRRQKSLMLSGDIASDPAGCVVLVGLGLRELAVPPSLIPLIKERLARHTLARAQALARLAMHTDSAEASRRALSAFIGE